MLRPQVKECCSHQKLNNAKRRFSPEPGQHLDFELLASSTVRALLLFYTTQFVVICYSSYRKQIHYIHDYTSGNSSKLVKFANHCPLPPSVFFCFVLGHLPLLRLAKPLCLQKQIPSSGSYRWFSKYLDPPHHIWCSQEPWGPDGEPKAENSLLYVHILLVHKAWCTAGTQSTHWVDGMPEVTQLPVMSLVWKQFFQLLFWSSVFPAQDNANE